jgi:hypothetical protein
MNAGCRKRIAALLQRNERPRQAGSGAIEEQPHAQRLGAFYGYQPHLSADMVDVVKQGQLRFVIDSVPLEARNPLLNPLPEPWADFKTFLRGTAGCHSEHLGIRNA